MDFKKFFEIILLIIISSTIIVAQNGIQQVTWRIDRTDSIGGFETIPLNDLPTMIQTQTGEAANFNGINDGMLIDTNPLGDANEFTIEVVFKPDSSLNPANKEQRFVHIRSGFDDNRRILIELRLYPTQRWALDTFIKSENSRCALLDSTINHPAGKWYHAALVYKNGIMTSYINGKKEMEGKVEYLPIANGKISIGARQDPRNWFKGAIKIIRFTKHALEPQEFITSSF